jgi:uncharacterized lipoprotein YbaY
MAVVMEVFDLDDSAFQKKQNIALSVAIIWNSYLRFIAEKVEKAECCIAL